MLKQGLAPYRELFDSVNRVGDIGLRQCGHSMDVLTHQYSNTPPTGVYTITFLSSMTNQLTPEQERFLSELYQLCDKHRMPAKVNHLSLGWSQGTYRILIEVQPRLINMKFEPMD